MTATGGLEVGFRGEYQGIVPNECIVSTEINEGMPDGEGATTAVTRTDENGRTP